MTRRTIGVCVTFALSLLVATLAAEAPPPEHIPRIGYLDGRSAADASQFFDVFRQGLRELGYVEGQYLVVESYYAEGSPERLAALAAALVRSQVAVIVTAGLAATRAAAQVTTTIPIVQAAGGDLVLAGLVASLASPGGNVTGLSIQDVEVGGETLGTAQGRRAPRVPHRRALECGPAGQGARMAEGAGGWPGVGRNA
jgi:putative ABC transport system substrate-binding protein